MRLEATTTARPMAIPRETASPWMANVIVNALSRMSRLLFACLLLFFLQQKALAPTALQHKTLYRFNRLSSGLAEKRAIGSRPLLLAPVTPFLKLLTDLRQTCR